MSIRDFEIGLASDESTQSDSTRSARLSRRVADCVRSANHEVILVDTGRVQFAEEDERAESGYSK